MAFNGKVALITGGSSGIGAATAVEFTKEGAQVVIVARNVNKLEKVSAECAALGKKPLVIKADLNNHDEASTIVTKTIDAFGTIDILVNNAAMVRTGSLLQGDLLESYDAIMATNLRPIVQVTMLATPHIVKAKGNIINISSIGAIKMTLDFPATAYCMAKAALNHFTRCAALELAPLGVRVNTVSPGPVMTDMVLNITQSQQNPASLDNIIKHTALNRYSEPVEIADLVLFLASDKACAITGSNYVTDNGMLLKV